MTYNNNIDDKIDDDIYEYLNISSPKSFFLFAGAGAGKTRTLVNVLNRIKKEYGKKLLLKKQQIAVITYTNNACEEIRNRLGADNLFKISTIHSYVWDLIKNYNTDIKKWLKLSLSEELIELKTKEEKGRSGTKASIDRIKKIEQKTEKLGTLDNVTHFTYNPNGDNYSKQSLNHNQVINICAYFLKNKPLMQKIMVQSFPILLIDESQDTVEKLVDAFFEVQKNNKGKFSLGLIGDTMQRIYSNGKEGLGTNLPEDWLTPSKQMNHRSDKRIVSLINDIREEFDSQKQLPRTDKEEGFVRLFLVSNSNPDKLEIESKIAKKMSKITKDSLWFGQEANVEVLAIEHHMIAKRNNFLELYEPLYQQSKFKTGLLDGTLSQLRLFTECILPLIEAKTKGDKFKVSQIVKKYSPLLKKENLKKDENQRKALQKISTAVDDLYSLWEKYKNPTIINVLQKIYALGLFTIPDSLLPLASRTSEEQMTAESSKDDDELDQDQDQLLNALDKAFSSPFSQIKSYHEYVSGKSGFETHQGVKGLEYERVMVVLDDFEARGFMFSYDKLFGAKELTQRDLDNINSGIDNSIDRTRRLFYVACSRAKKSLAVITYTDDVKKAKDTVLTNKWFTESEIEILE